MGFQEVAPVKSKRWSQQRQNNNQFVNWNVSLFIQLSYKVLMNQNSDD
jgi:hypothetical protein